MNGVYWKETQSQERAREPLSVTPFDISHSSAASVASGSSESVSRNAGRRLRAFSSPSSYKGFGGWTSGGLIRGFLSTM